MSALYRLDKIAVVHEGRVLAATAHEVGEATLMLRIVENGYYDVVSYVDEGKTWARGWEGPAYNALLTVVALSSEPDAGTGVFSVFYGNIKV